MATEHVMRSWYNDPCNVVARVKNTLDHEITVRFVGRFHQRDVPIQAGEECVTLGIGRGSADADPAH